MCLKWLSYSAIKTEQKPNGQKRAMFISGRRFYLSSVPAIPTSSFQTIKKVLPVNFSITTEFKSYRFHASNANWKLYQLFADVFLICEWWSSIFSCLKHNLNKKPMGEKKKGKNHHKPPSPIFFCVLMLGHSSLGK